MERGPGGGPCRRPASGPAHPAEALRGQRARSSARHRRRGTGGATAQEGLQSDAAGKVVHRASVEELAGDGRRHCRDTEAPAAAHASASSQRALSRPGPLAARATATVSATVSTGTATAPATVTAASASVIAVTFPCSSSWLQAPAEMDRRAAVGSGTAQHASDFVSQHPKERRSTMRLRVPPQRVRVRRFCRGPALGVVADLRRVRARCRRWSEQRRVVVG